METATITAITTKEKNEQLGELLKELQHQEIIPSASKQKFAKKAMNLYLKQLGQKLTL